MDAGQLNTLRTIANECPFIYGDAVYQARMLLHPYDSIGTEYSNPCNNSNHSMLTLPETEDGSAKKFGLYPNPNKGEMTLFYTLNELDKGEIVIYNLEGCKINSYILDANANSLSFTENELSNGVYLYHVYINNKIIQTDRIVIIK